MKDLTFTTLSVGVMAVFFAMMGIIFFIESTQMYIPSLEKRKLRRASWVLLALGLALGTVATLNHFYTNASIYQAG